jgi:hypothetical protein
MNIAGAGEQMGCVRPALLRQRSRFKGSEEVVDFNFGSRQWRHSLPLRIFAINVPPGDYLVVASP